MKQPEAKASDLIHRHPWRTLIIVDACRFDVLADAITQVPIAGEVREIDSEAICTWRWYEHHWSDTYTDVVLVGGNPVPWRINGFDKRVGVAIPSWKTNVWDPRRTIADAVKAAVIYPEMRMILHLLPPHLPYVGARGIKFMAELGFTPSPLFVEDNGIRHLKGAGGVHVHGLISHYGREHGWERSRACYRESVDYTLFLLADIVDRLPQPVIITSDHGELLGEDGRYGHNVDAPAVRAVPWFEVGDREAIIDERLRDLGYL